MVTVLSLHVPALEIMLLSIRAHRRRGQGCTFVADGSGVHLTFPSFVVSINDALDCTAPISRWPGDKGVQLSYWDADL